MPITDDLAQALMELIPVVKDKLSDCEDGNEYGQIYDKYTDAVEVLRRYDEGERE